MLIDVVLLPRDLQPGHLKRRAVVVFDVLRATTSMADALVAGVKEIRIFADTASALAAGQAFSDHPLLCGEEHCLPPAGFNLGNSPGDFKQNLHSGRTMFMSTTNGTRAIYAARGAPAMFVGALVNASAVAKAVIETGLDVTLLCAGTNGAVSIEDLLGAGAVLDAIAQRTPISFDSDIALIARQAFKSSRNDLVKVMHESRSGRNILEAHLEPDIEFSARLDCMDIVGEVTGEPPVVRVKN